MKQHLDSKRAKERKALQAAFNSQSSLYEDKDEEKRQKQLEKERKKQLQKEEKERSKKEWEDDCVKRLAENQSVLSFEEWEKEKKKQERKKREEARKEKMTVRRTSTVESDVSDSEDLDDILRGYKTTRDGKTTSYFSRELDENTKSLIGDIAPKKLTTDCPSNLSSVANQSAWNKAQTWEERDVTDWCKQCLEKNILQTNFSKHSHKIRLKIENVKGEASFAISSGKKRYIFDFNAKVDFDIIHSDDNVVASGSYYLPDISSVVVDHQYEMELRWNDGPNTSEEEDIAKDFMTILQNSVRTFVQQFNDQY